METLYSRMFKEECEKLGFQPPLVCDTRNMDECGRRATRLAAIRDARAAFPYTAPLSRLGRLAATLG